MCAWMEKLERDFRFVYCLPRFTLCCGEPLWWCYALLLSLSPQNILGWRRPIGKLLLSEASESLVSFLPADTAAAAAAAAAALAFDTTMLFGWILINQISPTETPHFYSFFQPFPGTRRQSSGACEISCPTLNFFPIVLFSHHHQTFWWNIKIKWDESWSCSHSWKWVAKFVVWKGPSQPLSWLRNQFQDHHRRCHCRMQMFTEILRLIFRLLIDFSHQPFFPGYNFRYKAFTNYNFVFSGAHTHTRTQSWAFPHWQLQIC